MSRRVIHSEGGICAWSHGGVIENCLWCDENLKSYRTGVSSSAVESVTAERVNLDELKDYVEYLGNNFKYDETIASYPILYWQSYATTD